MFSRKLLQNLSVIVNLFPGVLAMIAVYFVLKYLNLTNSYAGLIMVYAGLSGLGYLICKGFFDTIPISILFVIMQKFYVEGITSGADKG